MAGIYIHIPFCKQACNYCNFHFSTSTNHIDSFIDALLKEIIYKKDYLGNQPIQTIYFGGGTPSLLNISQFNTILNLVFSNYSIVDLPEITLEVNPENVTIENLKQWKQLGINRVSMGVQSFHDEELKFMNRSHNALQAISCLDLLNMEFTNYSVDLIFGSHLQNIDTLKNNIDTLLSFKPPHISCYALTVEEKTKLSYLVNKNALFEPKQEFQNKAFYLIKDCFENSGYNHYEISNYALPGFESKHNSSYWNGSSYLGFGPSAHSYNKTSRSWNIANNALYIKGADNFDSIIETEILTPTQIVNEFIMIGLRTKKGVNFNELFNLTNLGQYEQIINKVNAYIAKNFIENNNSNFYLTKEGLIFADGIASDLFVN
jgi:oxygen-independent coproporphyrinogen-3 oxidase